MRIVGFILTVWSQKEVGYSNFIIFNYQNHLDDIKSDLETRTDEYIEKITNAEYVDECLEKFGYLSS